MAKLGRKKGSKKPATGLAARIETIPTPDSRDADLSSHLRHFFTTFKDGLVLPEIDLSTPEGAQAALLQLEEQAQLLAKRQNTIRAFRKITEESGH